MTGIIFLLEEYNPADGDDPMSLEELGDELAKCLKATDTIPLLKRELLGRNRDTYINRIYGRYRKLLPKTDIPAIQQWRVQWGICYGEG